MDTDEETPFRGFPPLPKVFRESGCSPSPPPPPETGQEAAEGTERRCSGLRDKIAWLHAEMRRLRQADWALFDQLHTLALEIQDLRELQQEMESLSTEEPLEEQASLPAHVPSAGDRGSFRTHHLKTGGTPSWV
ncbi:UNVERIFIED_CONTAM: hypothetical protein K2H54_033643 [Gekko kuhli]